jgi:hypothetical protein
LEEIARLLLISSDAVIPAVSICRSPDATQGLRDVLSAGVYSLRRRGCNVSAAVIASNRSFTFPQLAPKNASSGQAKPKMKMSNHSPRLGTAGESAAWDGYSSRSLMKFETKN